MNLSDRKVNARAVARDVAMVFQSYNLYPHKTVLENVTLAPIKVLKVPREQAEREGRAYLDRVGLADKVDKYPDQDVYKRQVCGHLVHENELPDGFVCPVCGVGKEMFCLLYTSRCV